MRNTTGMEVQSDTEIADACTNIIYLFFYDFYERRDGIDLRVKLI